MRVTPRHRYCHSNTWLHRHGTAQPAPIPFVLVSFFNQSITILPDGSGSSHSSKCILVYTDSARFDSYEPDLTIGLNRISTISPIRYCSAIRYRYASFACSFSETVYTFESSRGSYQVVRRPHRSTPIRPSKRSKELDIVLEI